MRKEKCFIILTFMFGMTTAVSRRIDTSCITLDHEKGVCIEIDYCSNFRTLLENHSGDKHILKYVQKSICEFNGKIAKVCCPPENSETINRKGDNVVLSSKLPTQTSCGRSNSISIDIRIIGGNQSTLGAWPWVVALGYEYKRCSVRKNCAMMWNCGGTLISRTHVLTAAHCVNNTGQMILKMVRLGGLDLNDAVNDGATPLDVPVGRIISHPNYDKTITINDIALVKLKESVTYNNFIQPICLPISQTMKKPIIGEDFVFVVGYGITSPIPVEGGDRNTALMEIEVPITTCKKIQGLKSVIDDRVLCAGNPEGDADSCQGDSGGPLMWPQTGQYILMGIVSYGPAVCGNSKFPGVYTNVSSFMDWIVMNVNEN